MHIWLNKHRNDRDRFAGGQSPMAQPGQSLRLRRTAGYARRRWATWLAVLVLAAQVLLPFGQALASNGEPGFEYQLICTANGVKQILIDANGEPIDAHDAAPCPFCFTSTPPALLQPDDFSVLLEQLHVHPVVFARLAHLSHASTWRGQSQPSRAPPQLT